MSDEAWTAFLDRLNVLLDWRQRDGDGQWSWKCGDPETGDRLALAKRAAGDVGADYGDLMARAAQVSKFCCDCEIIFNCDDRGGSGSEEPPEPDPDFSLARFMAGLPPGWYPAFREPGA